MNPVPQAATAGLGAVLERGDVWRGDALARLEQPGIATGHPGLDAELPGGGWPRGSLTELLCDFPGGGEITLLLPALASLSAAGGWIALVEPPWQPYAPAWAAAGVALERLVVVRAGREAAWCCEQLLLCGGFAGVLAWTGRDPDPRTLRRLQVAAQGRPAFAVLWRGAAAAAAPSPAPLRLILAPSPAGLSVRLLKRRGRAAGRCLTLDLPRPERRSRALARPPFPPAAPRSPGPRVVA
ncbi:MAG TPA: translesion DNA synthesis-associated protein ImuA [Rhodocyclaceae bacterium]|nr:translesion DNA synthesis-associated protein ImuA [Rhodocyclaceae bacterium]HNM82451.1 translesion DNA synthesis-associated protein ImuA [Rhodocyclaceae bacterium]